MSWEAIIDQMKEWVIAQAYATEAWVLEWITPYHITGVLTPDATCTFFKAGTFNGKPYYKHTNGDWYIWWYGEPINEWWISVALGNADDGWSRHDPNIEGDYLPWHYSGTATVAVGRKLLCTSFIDRGDPAAWDWTVINFTRDFNWHDLDLSGIVPAGAKSVLFLGELKDDLVGKVFYLRKKGNVNTRNKCVVITQVSGIGNTHDLVCPCDSNRKVQYASNAVDNTVLNLIVKGWWL